MSRPIPLRSLFVLVLLALAAPPVTAQKAGGDRFTVLKDAWFTAPAGTPAEAKAADSLAALTRASFGPEAITAFRSYLEAPSGSSAERTALARVDSLAAVAGITPTRAREMLSMYYVVGAANEGTGRRPVTASVPGDKTTLPVGDTVYLLTSQPGIFRPMSGRVVDVTRTRLFLQTDSTTLMFKPAVVGWVSLTRSEPGDLRARFERSRINAILDAHWNKDRPVPIAIVQALPMIGPGLAFLDQLTPNVGNAIATLLLLAAMSWLGYQFYLAVVVARRQKQLNETKLQLEVARTRYETLNLGSSAGFEQEVQRLRKIVIPYLEGVVGLAAPQDDVRVREGTRAAPGLPRWIVLLGPVMFFSRKTFSRSFKLHQEDWKARAAHGSGRLKRTLLLRKLGRGSGVILLGFYGVIFLAMAASELVAPTPADAGFLAVSGVMGALLTFGAVRAWVAYKLMDYAFDRVFEANPEAAAAARAVAPPYPS